MAQAIVKVMVQVNPKTKELDNYEHKLWDHMFMISDFKLDVDSPFPKPDPEAVVGKPNKIKYPVKDIKYLHYGRTVQDLIKKCVETEEGEPKEAFVLSLANLMKRDYLAWNKNTVNDELIIKHLDELSGGKLKLKETDKLISTFDLTKNSTSSSNSSSSNNNRNNNNKKRSNNNNKNNRRRPPRN